VSYEISKRASADIDEIWDYIAHDDPTAADRIEDALHDAMLLLGRMPFAGPRREDLPRGTYRSWPVGSYLIIYRVRGRKVIVVRVLHGARDVRSIFRKK
jgi:plasmid stabilization system protein ParE